MKFREKVLFIISNLLILLCLIGILTYKPTICGYPPYDEATKEERTSIPLNEEMMYKGRLFRVTNRQKVDE